MASGEEHAAVAAAVAAAADAETEDEYEDDDDDEAAATAEEAAATQPEFDDDEEDGNADEEAAAAGGVPRAPSTQPQDEEDEAEAAAVDPEADKKRQSLKSDFLSLATATVLTDEFSAMMERPTGWDHTEYLSTVFELRAKALPAGESLPDDWFDLPALPETDLEDLQHEHFENGGFVSSYLQTEPREGEAVRRSSCAAISLPRVLHRASLSQEAHRVAHHPPWLTSRCCLRVVPACCACAPSPPHSCCAPCSATITTTHASKPTSMRTTPAKGAAVDADAGVGVGAGVAAERDGEGARHQAAAPKRAPTSAHAWVAARARRQHATTTRSPTTESCATRRGLEMPWLTGNGMA